jgi:hypothetical protein
LRLCKKCGDVLLATVVVDGRRRNLCSRKYCLNCRPFLASKGRMPAPGDRICEACNRPFLFRKSSGDKGGKCGSCVSIERRRKMKSELLKLKGNCCERCGYNRCTAALQFHHKDPATKRFTVGGNHNRSWEANRAEAEKCDLLCANCHAEVHAALSFRRPIVGHAADNRETQGQNLPEGPFNRRSP